MIIPITVADKKKYQIRLMRSHKLLTREEYVAAMHYIFDTKLSDIGYNIINTKLENSDNQVIKKIKKTMIKRCNVYFAVMGYSCDIYIFDYGQDTIYMESWKP